MKTHHSRTGSWIAPALALLFLILMPASAPAQDEEPGWLNVRVIEVRPSKAAEWEELQKEMNAAIKKAGMPGRQIWQVVRGEIDVYHIVTPVSKLGRNDDPASGAASAMEEADFERWVSRVNQCVGHREVFTLRRYPELNVPLAEGREPNLMHLSLRTHTPGNGRDYFNYLKDDLIPAVKKAKMDGVFVSRVFAGESVRMWAVATMVDKWSAFDEPHPIFKALGEQPARKLFQKGGALIDQNKTILLQYRADLSSEQ